MIYLDNNSTTRIHPDVVEAMQSCYQSQYVNPASQHAGGREARKRLEEAREGIARILGAREQTVHPDRVVFTSGGTEANNLVLYGLANSVDTSVRRRIIVSSVEHPSVSDCAEWISLHGHGRTILPVDDQGRIRLDVLQQILQQPADLPVGCVSVMMGNNETGVLQPIREIVDLCHPLGIPVHTDAVQCAGKIPVSFAELDVAAMSVTAHKFHGPRGIGALIIKHDLELTPQLVGGGQQLATRPGTESVALAVGMHTALEIWNRRSEEVHAQISGLRDLMQSQLAEALPKMVINGHRAERLPQTLNVAFPGADRQAVMLALDRAGIACSTGSACASGSSEPSPVLLAMGCEAAIVDSSIRFSLSAETTRQDVLDASAKIVKIVRQIQGFSGLNGGPVSARETT